MLVANLFGKQAEPRWRGWERKDEGEREGGKKTHGALWVFFHLSHRRAALQGRALRAFVPRERIPVQ
jgi:hypothetical protein